MVYPRIPQRIRRNRAVRAPMVARLIFAALLSFLVITPAHAGKANMKSQSPVFFDVRPDRALVYFANDLVSGSAYIYLDSIPVAFLPRRCYTAALVEPGFHLVWGTGEAKWYEFKAGWAYMLRLVKVGTLASVWVSDNPGMIRPLVLDKQLTYVTTHRDLLGRLQGKAQSRYRQALKRAGNELALPFQKRFHALDLKGKIPASLQAER